MEQITLTWLHRSGCWFDQAKGGMGYRSAQDQRIYFGLGSHAKIDSLEITWPSGAVDVIRHPTPDQIITVEEGRGLTSYRFPEFRKR